jgi:hypothetical protein
MKTTNISYTRLYGVTHTILNSTFRNPYMLPSSGGIGFNWQLLHDWTLTQYLNYTQTIQQLQTNITLINKPNIMPPKSIKNRWNHTSNVIPKPTGGTWTPPPPYTNHFQRMIQHRSTNNTDGGAPLTTVHS